MEWEWVLAAVIFFAVALASYVVWNGTAGVVNVQ